MFKLTIAAAAFALAASSTAAYGADSKLLARVDKAVRAIGADRYGEAAKLLAPLVDDPQFATLDPQMRIGLLLALGGSQCVNGQADPCWANIVKASEIPGAD